MAVHIGLFFLQKEHPVHWLSHSSKQLVHIDKILTKTQKRIQKYFPEKCKSFKATTSLYSSNIPEPDIIIESSRESLKEKQLIFDSLNYLITDRTLLLSNSSSILPDAIHPHCLGAHFFYPLELTNIVELISCKGRDHDHYQRSLQFLKRNGLDVIEQDQHSAFLINRLLLPLQALCFQALKNGFAPGDVEAASKSELISFGQLSLMDFIGLDIIHAAATNYQHCHTDLLNPDYDGLITALEILLRRNKLGAKNKDGLLLGKQLPWPQKEKTKEELRKLHKQFKKLLYDGYLQAIKQDMISTKDLHLALDGIFHAKTIPAEITNSTKSRKDSERFRSL